MPIMGFLLYYTYEFFNVQVGLIRFEFQECILRHSSIFVKEPLHERAESQSYNALIERFVA